MNNKIYWVQSIHSYINYSAISSIHEADSYELGKEFKIKMINGDSFMITAEEVYDILNEKI